MKINKQFSLKNSLTSLIIIFFGICCSIFIIEVFLRLVPGLTEAETWSDRPKAFYKAQNSDTMQDFVYSNHKQADKYRITVVGDSFTYATGMQFDDSFVKKLERIFNLGQSKIIAEVINKGVPGNSTRHEKPIIKKALNTGSDLVILQITLNDPQLKLFQPTGLTKKKTKDQETLSEENFSDHFLLYKLISTRFSNTMSHSSYKKYYFSLFENESTWLPFRAEIFQIGSICKSPPNTPKCVAVVFPLFGMPLDKTYPFHPLHKKVNKLLNKVKIPSLDLFEIYKNVPLERLQVEPGKDFHPNEIAHRMAAEHIFSWLQESKFIPEEFWLKELYLDRTQVPAKHEPKAPNSTFLF